MIFSGCARLERTNHYDGSYAPKTLEQYHVSQSLIEKSRLCATETQMRRALGLQGIFGARVPIVGLGTTCRGHLPRRAISGAKVGWMRC
jgi:hypothetical protein